MALDTTIGGTASDSYADANFATTYFTSIGKLADWQTYATSSTIAEQLLRRAMQAIENQDYLGGRANSDAENGNYQALEFPRRASFHVGRNVATDGASWTDKRGRIWADDEIPTPIKQAQCEQALSFGQVGNVLANDQYKRITTRAGSTTLERKTAEDYGPNWISPDAKMLLSPFLARGKGNGRTART